MTDLTVIIHAALQIDHRSLNIYVHWKVLCHKLNAQERMINE